MLQCLEVQMVQTVAAESEQPLDTDDNAVVIKPDEHSAAAASQEEPTLPKEEEPSAQVEPPEPSVKIEPSEPSVVKIEPPEPSAKIEPPEDSGSDVRAQRLTDNINPSVGDRVQVEWLVGASRGLYNGEVDKADYIINSTDRDAAFRYRFHVKYDDGDKRWEFVDSDTIRFTILRRAPTATNAPVASAGGMSRRG